MNKIYTKMMKEKFKQILLTNNYKIINSKYKIIMKMKKCFK